MSGNRLPNIPMNTELCREQELERLRLQELVEYDRYCYDLGHTTEQRKLWHNDGALFTTWFKGLVDEYLASTPAKKDKVGPYASHAHRVNNTIVWLHQTRAIAEVLCYLDFRSRFHWDWVDIQCLCRMHYRLEKRQGQWGIVYLEGIYEKDRMMSVFGDSIQVVPRQELEKYRPINWNMSIRRGYIGGGTDMNQWAGSDIPETEKRLYLESFQWLENI